MAKIAGKDISGEEEALNFYLQKLDLEKFKISKLELRDVLNIGSEICKSVKPYPLINVPWFFLQKLIGLIGTARILNLEESEDLDSMQEFSVDDFFDITDEGSDCVNPLDVVCALLHCSDLFLQQDIIGKMSMCQFAVPLLLPAGKGCTLLQWAMRDIVKTWRPKHLTAKKGFAEESIMHLPFTAISFVRLGGYTASKSHTLNQILSPEQQVQEFFVHRNMCGGNVKRQISDGLVEVAWYFPSGGHSDLFADPITMANLRGDLQHHKEQFQFLTKVSTILFIFIEITDVCSHQFTDIDVSNENFYFIVNLQHSKITDANFQTFLENLAQAKNRNYLFIVSKNEIGKTNCKYLKTLFPDLKGSVLIQDQHRQLVNKLRSVIKENTPTNNIQYTISLEEYSSIAHDLGMDVDENCTECKKPKDLAYKIAQNVKDVTAYKGENFKLQGHLWKELTKNEKELCRMRNQGTMFGEEYKSKINKQIEDLRKQQYQQEVSDDMDTFLSAIRELTQGEIFFFLRWLKIYLASPSIKNELLQPNKDESECKNQDVSVDHVGVEHFIRELGQLYEAECFMLKNDEITRKQTKFQHLPKIAAYLLFNGYPLELIDGDTSNIPLQWITAIMTELHNITQGKCNMKVISVLGVQSSGKSTLLNTMFGLQFPVARGRCTQGAFMNLLKVEDKLQEELGCHYILVIDTEGLKSPEKSSLDEHSEHDNELATLVVGLSNVTIINLSMENIEEIKDILQVVIHAFLRMKRIGKRPNCQFVHQNVDNVSAEEKMMRPKKILLEQLDELARIAAKMENNVDVQKFTDIIDYDIEAHNWYFPGFWHGVPPMASVSTGYSQRVFEFKMYLVDFFKKKAYNNDSINSRELLELIKSLWNAVKHEKFIFSFRSTLVANAYDQLCIAYSSMEWKFRKEAYTWRIKAENEIKSRISEGTECEMPKDLRNEMHHLLKKEEKNIKQSLEEFFDNGSQNGKLVEKYKEDFLRSASLLRNELENDLNIKCKTIIKIQTGKNKITAIQATFHEKFTEEASALLLKHHNAENRLSENDLDSEFETMWSRTFRSLNLSILEKRDIGKLMLEHLRREMRNKASYINEKLGRLDSLEKYCSNDVKIKTKHLEGTTFEVCKKMFNSKIPIEAKAIAQTALERCRHHVTNIANSKMDYNETFCQELLEIINKCLGEEDVQKFHFKPLFELDLKLLALEKAAPMFQKMHENFISENDPKLCLDKLKPGYMDMFKRIYTEQDDFKIRAQEFCNKCLKPAINEFVLSNLGNNIVDDIYNSTEALKYGCRTFFQTALLKDLLQEEIFDHYLKYCLNYEIFVKQWITKYIINCYKNSKILEELISSNLTAINKTITEALEKNDILNHTELSKGLNEFCKLLKNDLVISQDYINVITFESKVNVKQFFKYVKSFLCDIESQVKNELKCLNINKLLSMIMVQPQDELFKRVFGCGKQCPFCKVPCEAGGNNHKEHFASVHRPQGLAGYRGKEANILCHELCSTDVVSNKSFVCEETDWKPHPFKEYRAIYPEWNIQPDPSIEASLYWKYIYKEFNEKFAEAYNALPAEIPEDWKKITKGKALESLEKNRKPTINQQIQ